MWPHCRARCAGPKGKAAQAGLLNGKLATTHWAALDQLEQQVPQIQVQRTGKFVDEGPIITATALTAGFHMALHAVERLLGEQMAQAVAKGIDMEGHKPRE